MEKASTPTSDKTSHRAGSREMLVDLRGVARGQWSMALERSLRWAIRSGRLRPGARLPSTRALAADLGVSRGVVVQAYEQLAAEGYLTTRPGAAAQVNAVPSAQGGVRHGGARSEDPRARGIADFSATSATAEVDLSATSATAEVDLRPGSPNLGGLPRAEWARAVRKALATLTDAELGYGDSRGLPRLREALADYLGRVRGAVVDPDDLVVVNGFAQGLVVMSGVLADLGIRTVGVEDPGSANTSTQLVDHRVGIVPVPVDAEGLDITAIDGIGGAEPTLRAVLVTAAHQFPTGVVLSPARRLELVDWASRVDGLVVEDDYDAEYRFDHQAVGSIQGMAPDRVVLGGSVSKTLAPGIRLGWLAAPPALAADTARHKRAIDLMAPVLEQAALAELVTSGAYERHIRRSRATYRRRRELVVEVLSDELPEAEVVGSAAGLHLLVLTPWVTDEAAVERAALGRGVAVGGVRHHRLSPGAAGFVIGFGHLTDDQLHRAARTFAAAARTPRS